MIETDKNSVFVIFASLRKEAVFVVMGTSKASNREEVPPMNEYCPRRRGFMVCWNSPEARKRNVEKRKEKW
jgi:hypothetical protein